MGPPHSHANVVCAFAASPEPSIGFPVTGIIDGKFESGYLCTVMIGGEPLQGILYQCNGHPSYQTSDHHGVVTQGQTTSGNAARPSTMVRRRRRKKSEIKKRDPAHPKPNRSGYNFFFAEQHARLKPLHPGKDRDISRMIGELWNNLTDSKKAVYQEKAMKDKERYRIEMEHYRESLRTGRLVSNAVPLLQQLFKRDVNMMEFNETFETDGGVSPQTPENELTSGDKSSFEDEGKTADTDSNFGLPLVGAEIASMQTVSGGLMKTVIGGEEFPRDIEMDPKESNQQESISVHKNESKHDEKSRHDEPTMPVTIDENEKKHQFASMLEKMPVEFDGTVEHRTLAVEELEQVTSETQVQYEPKPLDPIESAAVSMNLEQEPHVLQENIPKVIDDGAQIEAAPTNEVELRPPEGRGLD
ncbi:High mobility group (HMG) box domain-containing protein [Cynara cardunculus var. scolymus]|uniref:High mobility group (HMG) box domain-containing protein n=1 Tax=Cynara cardunculus var. scolymus TaxID=59895 RepID=A0A103Y0S0_CYNCS|nr:High mobility group (HMG) box domain-containing protein [Cynara cardunculus var. scolymus]